MCLPEVFRASHMGTQNLPRAHPRLWNRPIFVMNGMLSVPGRRRGHPLAPTHSARYLRWIRMWWDRWSRAFHSCRSCGSLSKVRCSLATGPLITPNTNLKTSHDVTDGLCPHCLSLSRFCPSISVFRSFLPILFLSFSLVCSFVHSFLILVLWVLSPPPVFLLVFSSQTLWFWSSSIIRVVSSFAFLSCF
jgi:hypothetical protein